MLRKIAEEINVGMSLAEMLNIVFAKKLGELNSGSELKYGFGFNLNCEDGQIYIRLCQTNVVQFSTSSSGGAYKFEFLNDQEGRRIVSELYGGKLKYLLEKDLGFKPK